MKQLFKSSIFLIQQNDLNNWNIYYSKLIKYNLVRKYFENHFQFWVKKLLNPLELYLLFDLLNDKLDYLEKNLLKLENLIGETNLRSIINEIENLTEASEIMKKLNSLSSELSVYAEIRKSDNTFKKVDRYYDWENDCKCVSVKCKLSLSFNYTVIGNFLRSLYFVAEYKNVMSNFDTIIIDQEEGINDTRRKNIISVLRKNLFKILNVNLNKFLECSEGILDRKQQYESLEIHINIRQEKQDIIVNIHIKDSINAAPLKLIFKKNLDFKKESQCILSRKSCLW